MMIKNKVKSITKNLDTITCVNALVVKDLTCSILVGKKQNKKSKINKGSKINEKRGGEK